MAEYGAGFRVYADASQFQREMRQSVESAKQVQRGLKDIGLNIGGLLGVSGVVAGFKSIIESAQQTRDEMEKIGRTLDSSTASVAGLGDGFDKLWKSTKEGAVWFLSAYTEMGDGIGKLINRILGVSAEQEKVNEQTARDADKAEKARDEAYRNRKSIEDKLAADRARATEKARQDADRLAEEEFDALVKIGTSQKDLDEKRAKNAHDRLDDNAKIADTEKQLAVNGKLIADYKKNGALSSGDQLRVIELQNKQEDLNVQLARERADAAKAITEAEKETLAVMQEIQTVGRGDRDLSDRELERKRAELEADVSSRRAGLAQGGVMVGVGYGDRDALLGPQQLMLNQLNAELELRRTVRRDASVFGQDAAFNMHSGLTERRFSEILQGFDPGAQVNLLRDIKDILKNQKPIGGKS